MKKLLEKYIVIGPVSLTSEQCIKVLKYKVKEGMQLQDDPEELDNNISQCLELAEMVVLKKQIESMSLEDLLKHF